VNLRWPRCRLTLVLVMTWLGCLLVGYVMARYLGRMSPAEDYLWRAPALVERVGAWWALLGACLIILAMCAGRLRDPRWRCRGWPLLGLVVAAFGIGVAGGTAGRPVNGANIGGAGALLFGLPILAIVVVVSAATVVRSTTVR